MARKTITKAEASKPVASTVPTASDAVTLSKADVDKMRNLLVKLQEEREALAKELEAAKNAKPSGISATEAIESVEISVDDEQPDFFWLAPLTRIQRKPYLQQNGRPAYVNTKVHGKIGSDVVTVTVTCKQYSGKQAVVPQFTV